MSFYLNGKVHHTLPLKDISLCHRGIINKEGLKKNKKLIGRKICKKTIFFMLFPCKTVHNILEVNILIIVEKGTAGIFHVAQTCTKVWDSKVHPTCYQKNGKEKLKHLKWTNTYNFYYTCTHVRTHRYVCLYIYINIWTALDI